MFKPLLSKALPTAAVIMVQEQTNIHQQKQDNHNQNAVLKMVAEDCPWDEDLRAWLEIYLLENPKYNTNILSRSYHIGIPRQVLDSYLAGEYFLPAALGGKGNDPQKSKVEEAVRLFRQKIEGSDFQTRSFELYETETWKQLKKACQVALDEKTIVIICGNPGVGKSLGLREFAAREMLTPPVSILCSRNITTFNFVEQIARELNLKGKGTVPEIENQIIARVQRSPRVLFVDQANFLGAKSFGSIMHIREKAHIPIVVCGTLGLLKIFSDQKISDDLREQFASRIGYSIELIGLTLGEVKTIVKRSLGDETDDANIAEIYNLTRQSFRRLNILLARIKDLMRQNEAELASGAITLKELVEIAAARLILF